MRIKDVSALKGLADIFHQRPARTLNRRTSMPALSNSNPAITKYLLEQQKKRFISQRNSLELRLIENERGLAAVLKDLDLLTESNFSLSARVTEKEGKKLNRIRLDY